MRLLGQAWRTSSEEAVRRFLLHEVVARAAKRHWVESVSAARDEDLAVRTAGWLSETVVALSGGGWRERFGEFAERMFTYALAP